MLRILTKNRTRVTWHLPKKVRKSVTDSLLLDSGTKVFTARKGPYTLILRVVGDVRILWEGEIYKTPSHFPEDLVNAIREHRLPQDAIAFSNWYESFFYKNGREVTEPQYEEIDLDTLSEKEIRCWMHDIISEAEKNEDAIVLKKLTALRSRAFDMAASGKHGEYPLDLEEFNKEVEDDFSDDGTVWTAHDGTTITFKDIENAL